MTKPVNMAAIEKETGMTWEDWLLYLESINAKDLSHTEIAREIHESGLAGDWWAQSVTVAYEQHIGRRVPGQRSDGKFDISVSKTVEGNMDEVRAIWSMLFSVKSEINGVAITRGPDMSESEKWRYWRCGLADGTRVAMTFADKAGGKTAVGLGHEGIATQESADEWRAFWKQFFKKLD